MLVTAAFVYAGPPRPLASSPPWPGWSRCSASRSWPARRPHLSRPAPVAGRRTSGFGRRRPGRTPVGRTARTVAPRIGTGAVWVGPRRATGLRPLGRGRRAHRTGGKISHTEDNPCGQIPPLSFACTRASTAVHNPARDHRLSGPRTWLRPVVDDGPGVPTEVSAAGGSLPPGGVDEAHRHEADADHRVGDHGRGSSSAGSRGPGRSCGRRRSDQTDQEAAEHPDHDAAAATEQVPGLAASARPRNTSPKPIRKFHRSRSPIQVSFSPSWATLM